jgi:hypothetical protein
MAYAIGIVLALTLTTTLDLTHRQWMGQQLGGE